MKLKAALLNLFLLAGTTLHAESIDYKVFQDSTAKPSKVRISADFEYGANLMGLGEGVLQTYDLIPGLFLEGRFKASLPGMSVLIPWTWYETEARVGFRLPKSGYRDGGFDIESKRGLARIPANRTWVPYLGLQSIHQRASLTDEEKAKPDHDPVLIRPGQSLTFAIGLHRDIAHPSSRVKPDGYEATSFWNFATTHDLGVKYSTMEIYDKDKKKYEGGYPALFWDWERFYTPFTLGVGLELTYSNSMYTPTMFHLNIGTNFKL